MPAQTDLDESDASNDAAGGDAGGPAVATDVNEGGDGKDTTGEVDYGAQCFVELLELGEPGVSYSACRELAVGGFECDCGDGEWAEAGGDECDEVLDGHCAVDDLARETCVTSIGACRPDSNGDWQCLCDGAEELTGVSEVDACDVAAFSACAGECESAAGSCAPGSEPLEYDCGCSLYGERTVDWDGYDCKHALEYNCEAGNGLNTWNGCTSETGYCNPVGNPGTWSCQCLDGTEGEATPTAGTDDEEGAFEPDCGMALLEVCGEPEPGPNTGCRRETAAGTAECQAEGEGEGTLWTCTCSLLCPDGTGAFGGPVEAESCAAAMDTFCGVDGPSCE